MGKASRSKRDRTGVERDVWFVSCSYADDTGELRALASYREARSLYEELTKLAADEPGMLSVDLLDFAGRPLLGPEADSVPDYYVSAFAGQPRGARAGKWRLAWPQGENAPPEFVFDDGSVVRC